MRIGIFYRDYEADGGFPRDWQRFAWELGELHERVTVYTYSGAQVAKPHPNVEVKRFAGSAALSFRLPHALSATLAADGDRLDILELVGAYIPENIAVARCARNAGIPYVYTLLGHLAPKIVGRHPIKKRLFIEAFLRRALRRAAGIHLFSEAEEHWVRRYANRPAIRTSLGAYPEDIPGELDLSYLRRRLRLPEDETIVLYLGRLDVIGKGLTTLIEGFRIVRAQRTGVHLALIGPDQDGGRGVLTARIEQARLTPHVSILEPLQGPAKFSAMGSADLFVYPSNYDVIPRSIREALSAGCPVLASAETHVGSILNRYDAGDVTPVDAGEIARAILRLTGDRRVLAAMRQNARRASREALDWRMQATHLRDGYRRLLANGPTLTSA